MKKELKINCRQKYHKNSLSGVRYYEATLCSHSMSRQLFQAEGIHLSESCTVLLVQNSLVLCCRPLNISSSTLNINHYCICTVHVIRSLNCQYQHMHNFNVID